jgi:predicted kinase
MPEDSDPIHTPASILLVSGAPASGKSTVARLLAARLPFALLSKDTLKECLFDALGSSDDEAIQHSRRLSLVAMELLWTVAAACPHVILEANFRPLSDYERNRIRALPGRKLEIYCKCSPEEAQRRFAQRAQQPGHHPTHALHIMSPAMVAEYDRPMGVCPLIEVDTEASVQIDLILQAVRQHWPEI